MKRILFFLLLSFTVVEAFAQHPIGTDSLQLQTLVNSKTLVKSRGAIGADSGFVNSRFVDTIQANLNKIHNYPGGQIIVGDQVWVRDSAATKWISIGSGSLDSIPNLQLVTNVGDSTTRPMISGDYLAVQGDDSKNNSIYVNSPSKGTIGTAISFGHNPALIWNLPWHADSSRLYADSADGQTWQMPNASGFLALSVNGQFANVFGDIIDTLSRPDTSWLNNYINNYVTNILGGPLFITLLSPLRALNDSTEYLDSFHMPQLRYIQATRDTTLWTDSTLVDRQYLNDRLGAFTGGGGGSQDLQSVTDIGNTTTNEIVSSNNIYVLTNGSTFPLMGITDGGTFASVGMSVDGGTSPQFFWTRSADGATASLRADNTTGSKIYQMPDHNGTVVVIDPADDFANDAAAAAGGINVGEFYHTSGTVKVRLL